MFVNYYWATEPMNGHTNRWTQRSIETAIAKNEIILNVFDG